MTLNLRYAVINFAIRYSGVLQFNHSITNFVRWGYCLIESLIILHTHTHTHTHTYIQTHTHTYNRWSTIDILKYLFILITKWGPG